MTAWRDLETRGFVVVRGFLGAADLATLRDDFVRGAPPERYPHGFKLVGRLALARMTERIAPLLADVRAATALTVDLVSFLTMSHYITTARVERTSHWHQDFDLEYGLTGDHIDALNFWVAVAKPERERSNVCVVPFDRLLAAAPEAHAALLGSGGHRLLIADAKTTVLDEGGAVERVVDLDLEALAETPLLDAGDLLLLRGDTIHRTQDAATTRVAASIRATSRAKTIKRARLGPRPDARDPAAAVLETIHDCFAARGDAGDEVDAISIGDYLAFVGG